MMWFEVRLSPDADIQDFYTSLDVSTVERFHHFWAEPWWPGAYVVRVKMDDADTRDRLEALPGVDHVVDWSPSEDQERFGSAWEWMYQLFEASSALCGLFDEPKGGDVGILHWVLNARGYSIDDEVAFGRKFLAGRLWAAKRMDSEVVMKVINS